MDKEIKVSICCATYNHEKFIRDAIEGFLIQKTSFPIEILTNDGTSTHNTTDNVYYYQSEHPELINRKSV